MKKKKSGGGGGGGGKRDPLDGKKLSPVDGKVFPYAQTKRTKYDASDTVLQSVVLKVSLFISK